MRHLIRVVVVLSVLAGVAAAGCGSSGDDSGAAGAMSGGSAGTSSSGGKGGSSGSGTSGAGGTSTAGAGTSGSGGTSSGAGGSNAAAGADNSAAGADNAAGAGGAGPQACNSLSYTGASLNFTHTSASVPTLSNGTLQAGDYRLTSGGFYDGGSGISYVGYVAHVSVVDSTATIELADNYLVTSTTVIVMGQPSSAPPTSVKITCDSNPALAASVGVEQKTAFKYDVTGNTFSVYEAPLKLLLVFTLQT